ncbi:MAG: hypothetical protein MJE77_27795 [Proteobacteria bacterium]|nr:hypothetical protein [Pseudomonadota bacterium]
MTSPCRSIAAAARPHWAVGPRVIALSALLVASAASRAEADPGHDFAGEAKLLYSVVACGSEQAASASHSRPGRPVKASIVEAHCREQKRRIDAFRRKYVAGSHKFFAKLRRVHLRRIALPERVLYPFGGGDLLSALVTYPDAAEYTTISLEHAGDPRRLGVVDSPTLEQSLALFREVGKLFVLNHDHRSDNLRKLEKGAIPGQLAFFLMALAICDYEPVALKYFRVKPDGSLHYYSAQEIEQLAGTLANKKAEGWVDTDHSVVFSNMELVFRKRGQAGAPLRIHRHIAANLDNNHFSDSPLLAHLEKKGPVAAMTKAASYLLWNRKFSAIRNYLLGNMVFMISDSTGIPPRFTIPAGYMQFTYGAFEGALLEWPRKMSHNDEFVALWQSQPERKLRFRYGYVDLANNYHLLVTTPSRWLIRKRSLPRPPRPKQPAEKKTR